MLDRDKIIAQEPRINEGLDMVYVDSKHTPKHVLGEINTWMPKLKVGGRIYFDDVDDGPYRAGRRKDSPHVEIANRSILRVIENYFRRHTNHLRLIVYFGSTGLACLEKTSEFSGRPAMKLENIVGERRILILYTLMRKLGLAKYYVHKRDGSDFIIKHDQNLPDSE